MPEVKSIQSALLGDTAGFVTEDVAAVLINDTVKVTEFKLKQVTGNAATIEYSVTSEMTNLITNIKLLNADDAVLTQATVYVPVTQTVVSKHIITVREGT